MIRTQRSKNQQQNQAHHLTTLRVMMKEMFLHTRTQWGLIVLGVVFVTCISLLEFIIPQLTKNIIDQIIPDERVYALLESGALILLAALLLGALNFGSSFVMTLVSQKAILQLRNKLYQHTLRLDLKFFDH